MSLKETFKEMHDLLTHITADLQKSEKGNKAASQRVRTGTVKLEKVAKLFRKESIAFEKKNKGQKKPAKPKAKASAKAKPVAKHPVKHPAKHKAAHAVAKPKALAVKGHAKPKSASASFKSRPLAVRRHTAKLPGKHLRTR